MPSMLTQESFLNEGLLSTKENDDRGRGRLTPPTTPNPINASSSNIDIQGSCRSDKLEMLTKEAFLNKGKAFAVEEYDMARHSPSPPNPLTAFSLNMNSKESYLNNKLLLPGRLTPPLSPNNCPKSSEVPNIDDTSMNQNSFECKEIDSNYNISSTEQLSLQNIPSIESLIDGASNSLLFLTSTSQSIKQEDQVHYVEASSIEVFSLENDKLLLPVDKEFAKGIITPPLPQNTLPKPSEVPNYDIKSQTQISTKSNPVDVNNEVSCTEQIYSDNTPQLQSVKDKASNSLLWSTSQSTKQGDQVPCVEATSIENNDLPIICATYYDNLPEPSEEAHLIQNTEQISTTDLTEKLNNLQLAPESEQLKVPDETTLDTDKPPKKRASSLKVSKTPPDQKQKKIVKFADVFGLDIEDVREFMKGIPDIPKSAFSDLTDTQVDLPKITPKKCLSSHFKDPCDLPDFWERVLKQKICVERVMVGDNMSIRGVIRVLNLSFDKKCIIRYTFDKWKTHHEATATYLAASNDGVTDQFSFLLWGNFLKDKGSLYFVVRYETLGQEYWDNNKGQNYKLHCAESLPGTPYSSNVSLEKSEKTPSSTTSPKRRVSRDSFSIPKHRSKQRLIDSLNNDDSDDILQKEELFLNNKEPDKLVFKEDINIPIKSTAIQVPNAEANHQMSSFRIDSSPADSWSFRFY